MKIFLNALVAAGFGLAFFLATKTLEIPHQEYQDDPTRFLYEQGNATPAVRTQIMEQLELFSKGYEERDTSILDTYMAQLFSKENILILGTLPGEIFIGSKEAADLISSDWLYWGDVHLLAESSSISVRDSVAWFSMIGHVEFDLSRWLDLPLRVTGVMVQSDRIWKFQQLQFQFDLNFSWILYGIILLAILFLASFIRLLYLIIRSLYRKNRISSR